MFSLLRQLTELDKEPNVFADYHENTPWPDIVAYVKTSPTFTVSVICTIIAVLFIQRTRTWQNRIDSKFSRVQSDVAGAGFTVNSGAAEGYVDSSSG